MVEEEEIENTKQFIQDNFVSKLMSYLRGEATRVVTNKEYMKVYNAIIYQCDTNDNNDEVHCIFHEFVEEYLQQEVIPKIQGKEGEQLLINLVEAWDLYCIYSKMMDRSFEYLNRYYLKNHNLPTTGKSCHNLFKDTVYRPAKDQINAAILAQLKKQRNSEQINRETVKKSIQFFVDMGLVQPKPMRTPQGLFAWQGDRHLQVYDDDFESAFLQATQEQFSLNARVWNQDYNCPEYLLKVQAALANEEQNADYWLQPETKTKMLQIVERELVTSQAEIVASKDTGCVFMFNQKNLEELKLLYNVFSRDPDTFDLIILQMNPYIIERGKKIVLDEENIKDPYQFTTKLLQFKDEMDEMINYSFTNQMKFQRARDNSFQDFMNQQQFTPIYIAQYTDKEFRQGLKGLPDDEVDQRLNQIIRIFCCLHGRDEFIKQYCRELASRLLNKSSISQEHEEKMIQKLKVECGANQVQKMSQMFKDISLSREMQTEFTTHAQKGQALDGIEFVPEVLTNGTWPQMESPLCTLGPELQLCVQKFEMFFKQKQSNRTLTWLYGYGSVELIVNYTPKKYQLIVNVFQASILTLFNENEVLTCEQIMQKGSMRMEQFKPAMMKLCEPKVQVLSKEIKKPVFEKTEKIKVNPKFAQNNIRLNLIPQKIVKKKTTEATAEETAAFKQVAKERQFVVQAHIVKVMKSQKTYSFQLLLTDVIRNISMFKADPKVVKEQIEVLIQGDYMKRDENNRATLIYLP